mgnify:CR=1 FL=1
MRGKPNTVKSNEYIVGKNKDGSRLLSNRIDLPANFIRNLNLRSVEGSHTLELSLPQSASVQYSIYSLDAKLLSAEKIEAEVGINSIPLEEPLCAGIYILNVSVGTEVQTIKFVVQ